MLYSIVLYLVKGANTSEAETYSIIHNTTKTNTLLQKQATEITYPVMYLPLGRSIMAKIIITFINIYYYIILFIFI